MQATPVGYIEAVSIALVDRDKVLLVKRGHEPSKGLFAFPGGRVEPGESLEQAVQRELMEETALTAEAIEMLEVLHFHPSRASATGYVLTVFAGTLAGGTLQAGDDASEAGWFTLEEMQALPLTGSTGKIARRLLAHALQPPESSATRAG